MNALEKVIEIVNEQFPDYQIEVVFNDDQYENVLKNTRVGNELVVIFVGSIDPDPEKYENGVAMGFIRRFTIVPRVMGCQDASEAYDKFDTVIQAFNGIAFRSNDGVRVITLAPIVPSYSSEYSSIDINIEIV